jgi:hypothetical protein
VAGAKISSDGGRAKARPYLVCAYLSLPVPLEFNRHEIPCSFLTWNSRWRGGNAVSPGIDLASRTTEHGDEETN